MRTIETQLRQYHVTKVGGAGHTGEPRDHKSKGLEPLSPIGVYAYTGRPKKNTATEVANGSEGNGWLLSPVASAHGPVSRQW